MPTTIMADSQVSYPGGETAGQGTLLWFGTVSRGRDGRTSTGFVLDETPFHPLEPSWPDQPGDIGRVVVADESLKVIGTHTITAKKGEEIAEDQNFRVRRGDLL
jgi:alanyl-tRNA synthetase